MSCAGIALSLGTACELAACDFGTAVELDAFVVCFEGEELIAMGAPLLESAQSTLGKLLPRRVSILPGFYKSDQGSHPTPR